MASAGLAWDLECALPKRDDESWDAYARHAGVTIACTIDLESGQPTFYTPGDQDGYSLYALANALETASLVVSYNGEKFDNLVLGYAIGRQAPIIPKRSIDLCKAIFQAKNGRQYPNGTWKLGRVAKDTIGITKTTTSGAQAPTLWRNGQVGEIASYVWQDVNVTIKLYEHILAQGWVVDHLGNRMGVDLG